MEGVWILFAIFCVSEQGKWQSHVPKRGQQIKGRKLNKKFCGLQL